MTEDQHLPLFITEPIYLVDEGAHTEEQSPAATPPSKNEEPAKAPVPATPKEDKATPTPTIPKIAPKTHELAIWTPPLTSTDKELLVKILLAIKKDFNAAHLMEGINSYDPHYKQLLCFGYHKELELKLGESIATYTPVETKGHRILVSVSPADLAADPAQKKRLWEALQKMFL
ncbi:hypothetical protein [Marinoscillum furvescens]|uniref:Uncharacterized protein n=1 Tax=Marinoscillum furvescens DSM 4134 TaxID=1122208 RepID=A0A3D9KZ97_MARFU|nr:hypothetical protein [Marinoscillum furvescens]RED95612.1 hypothetical protein C7460_11762 [Marinoscillum furvescens DSM 4134]